MDFSTRFNAARTIAETLDWQKHQFSWAKAYVASVIAAAAYEEIPPFELKKPSRAKVIPCDSFQANIARVREGIAIVPSLRRLDVAEPIQVIIRRNIIVTITRFTNVIFISLRGTTPCYDDYRTDLDFRKTKYSFGLAGQVKFHRGFFDAVADCFDEVVEKIVGMNAPLVPIHIAGHSLGGAMAAIFHARLAEHRHPFLYYRRHEIQSSISCYTFGMPRYGDPAAVAILPAPFHIFNEMDGVPTVPPTQLGFADSPNERCINAIPDQFTLLRKGNLFVRTQEQGTSILGGSDHRLEKYLDRLYEMRNR